jgi:hypothetical protein
MLRRGRHKIELERYGHAKGDWDANDFLWDPNSINTRLEKVQAFPYLSPQKCELAFDRIFIAKIFICGQLTRRTFRQNDVAKVEWLDRHTNRQIEHIKNVRTTVLIYSFGIGCHHFLTD